MVLSYEKRQKRNAYMREWKRKNKEKVNAINLAVKAKRPDHYREINRLSAEKMRDLDPERFTEAAFQYRKKNAQRYLVVHAKARANKLGVPFDLKEGDLVFPEFCPVLGIKLEFGRGKRGCRNHASPSMDRLIPEKGYTKENVRIISNRANYIKANATAAEHRAVADYIERETRFPVTGVEVVVGDIRVRDGFWEKVGL